MGVKKEEECECEEGEPMLPLAPNTRTYILPSPRTQMLHHTSTSRFLDKRVDDGFGLEPPNIPRAVRAQD